MTINETSFFRDNRPFELLRTELAAAADRTPAVDAVRCGSGARACSTGQEALSLAMLLREHFPQLLHWNIAIEGTDICAEVVERARGRALSPHRGEPRPASALSWCKYFDQVGRCIGWRKPEIRELCHFRQANLCAPQLPFTGASDRST